MENEINSLVVQDNISNKEIKTYSYETHGFLSHHATKHIVFE